MPNYDAIVEAMYEYFYKHGISKPIEYAYGFFDAVAALRAMQEKEKAK